MENQHSQSVNVTVAMKRPREYLTEKEIERLMDAARENRWGRRDATAILLAYRHGLRAGELVNVRWDDFDLTAGRMHIRRAKGSESACTRSAARKCERYAGYNGKPSNRCTCS